MDRWQLWCHGWICELTWVVFSVERSYPPGTTMLLTWTGSTLGVAVSYLQDALRLRKEGRLACLVPANA